MRHISILYLVYLGTILAVSAENTVRDCARKVKACAATRFELAVSEIRLLYLPGFTGLGWELGGLTGVKLATGRLSWPLQMQRKYFSTSQQELHAWKTSCKLDLSDSTFLLQWRCGKMMIKQAVSSYIFIPNCFHRLKSQMTRAFFGCSNVGVSRSVHPSPLPED